MLLSNLRQRLARDEGGFTLIELLVVLIIIAVLLAIAIPSYLSFKDRAEKRAAQSDVRAAVPSVEAYYSDKNSYDGMTKTVLVTDYDQALKLDAVTESDTSYCISRTVGNWTAWKSGPAGDIQVGAKGGAGVGCAAAA